MSNSQPYLSTSLREIFNRYNRQQALSSPNIKNLNGSGMV